MEMKSEPTPAWSAHHPVLCGYVKMILGDLCIVHVVVRSSRADASVWTTMTRMRKRWEGTGTVGRRLVMISRWVEPQERMHAMQEMSVWLPVRQK